MSLFVSDEMSLFLSAAGRIPRYRWWIGTLAVSAFLLVVFLLLSAIFGTGFLRSANGRAALFVLQLVWLYVSYCLFGKRFQDRAKPASFALIWIGPQLLKLVLDTGVTGSLAVPNLVEYGFATVNFVVGVWFLVELGFLRGTVGPNRYGPDPVER
ncbi:MAG TPA: DUF805 domain-containing protein [Stellaceae bacterium]|nr:DUF805 domain-containing protein [Stellaceae bacterium]